jgi:hypothetical protein
MVDQVVVQGPAGIIQATSAEQHGHIAVERFLGAGIY